MGIEMMLLATTAASAMSGFSQGQQQKKAYDLQAKQAQLEAESNVTDRTRALNEALAMQNAAMGSSGRTLESASAILEGDKKRYEQDVGLIRAGAKSQGAQYKMAGKAAQAQGAMNAISTIGKGAYQYSMLGGPSSTSSKG